MEVTLCNFSSIYELIVAFTFAYNGISSFKEWVNELISHSIGTKLQALKAELFVVTSIEIDVDNSSSFEAIGKNLIKDKRTKLNNQTTKFSANFDSLQSGNVFYTQFFLTGFFYISILLLAGLQDNLKDVVFFPLVLITTLYSLIFLVVCIYKIRVRLKNPDGEVLKFNPVTSLLYYVCIYAGLIFALKFGESVLVGLVSYFNFSYAFLYRSKLVILVLSFVPAIIPFFNFTFSKKLYEERIESTIDKILMCDDMRTIQAQHKEEVLKALKNASSPVPTK